MIPPLNRLAPLLSRLPGLKSAPAARAAAIALGVLTLLAVAALLLFLVPRLPGNFWRLVLICAFAFALLWWFLAGSQRFSRRGLSRRRLGDLGPGNPEDEREPLARMQQAIAQAKQTIARSPEIEHGRASLYRIPWLLFVGDEAADVPGLLHAANAESPFPPPHGDADDAAQVWRWWFFKNMIAVEMHARIVCDAQDRLERGLWYQALRQLAAERDKLPLNGIVVCVSAQTLLAGPDAIKPVGMRLRRLVDEALEHLQVRLPVYLVVTELDALPGYRAFRAALPPEALKQALGHRLGENEVINAATSGRLDDIYAPIVDRLHALRLSALRAQHDADGRRDCWTWVQALQEMTGGLRTLVDLMLQDNPFQRTPRWRGLYLVANATGADDAGGGFVSDLFARFLPADQPLASPSLRGNTARLATASVGVAAMLGLSAALSTGLAGVRQDDSRLQAKTRLACENTRNDGAAARIAWLARCGRTIEELETASADSGPGFGLRRADADIERLKQTVVQDFSNLILAPYDQNLEAELGRRQAGLEHLLAVAQRLRLLEHCRERNPACLEQELPYNVTFDPAGRLFSPFVSGEQDTRADREHAADLLTTYLGYLRWQDRVALDAEAQRLRRVLEKILAAYTPRPEDVETWARARRDGISLTDLWLPADRVVGVEAGTLPAVPAAYLLDVWKGYLHPMLAASAAQDVAGAAHLQDFRNAYFNAYFRHWANFDTRFFEGTSLWRGQYAELARRAATHENPYQQLLRATERHLTALPLALPAAVRWGRAWALARQDWLGAWRPLGRFATDTMASWLDSWRGRPLVAAPAWLLAQIEQTPELAAQEPLYARAYLRLLAAGDGADSYHIAAALFRGDTQAANSAAADYATLLHTFDKPSEAYAVRFRNEDLAAWSVMQGPARLLLFLTLQDAGQYIQQRWRDSVVAQLRALAPKEQVAALYGEQGRLAAFISDWLGPFVTQRERSPVKVAGLAIPLSAGYAAMISAERKFLPILDGGTPFPAGTFQFTRPSQFGNRPEGPQGTQLEIVCKERSYTASSAAVSLAESRIQVFWSPEHCTTVNLRIALPAEPAPPPVPGQEASPAPTPALPPPAGDGPRLTRVYNGADGFVQLLNEFKNGAHVLRLADFRSAHTAAQWQSLQPRLTGIGSVRVYLGIQLSEPMQRYLSARTAPATIPESILE